MSVLFSPDGDDLSDAPRIRSLFQKAIGEQGLEAKLARLAKDPRIIASLEQMYKDINSGDRSKYETKDYYHNRIIGNLFEQARRKAWATLTEQDEVIKLKEAERKRRIGRAEKARQTASSEILNIYK